jgi:DNA-binding response OmpR family regulator
MSGIWDAGGRTTGPPARRDLQRAPRRPLSVLIVDPDRRSAERMARALAGTAAVAVVPTGEAALAAIRAHVPDLIATELDLPDGDGVRLIAAVHAAPATHNVLLLVATARAGVRDKIAAFGAGADDYLVKPLDAELFVERVLLLSRFRQVLGGS